MRAVAVLALCCLLGTEALAQARITSIAIEDGNGATGSVDSAQGSCASDDDSDLEPFFDSTMTLVIRNPDSTSLRMTSMRYRITSTGTESLPTSKPVAFFGQIEVPARSTGTQIKTLFLSASNGRKLIPGSTTPLPAVSFRNVRVTVRVKDGRGKTRVLRGRTAISVNNYNRCGS